MNPIEYLRDEITRRFPDCQTEIFTPVNEQLGSWFLAIHRGGDLPPVMVEWQSDRGFGISSSDEDDYGAGPDEVYTNATDVLDRLVHLIESKGQTEEPRSVKSQEDLERLRAGIEGPIDTSDIPEQHGPSRRIVRDAEGQILRGPDGRPVTWLDTWQEKPSSGTFQFTLILAGADDLTEKVVDALYEAGCADGTVGMRNGAIFVAFDRVAPRLADAITSAVHDVLATGLTIIRIEIDDPSVNK